MKIRPNVRELLPFVETHLREGFRLGERRFRSKRLEEAMDYALSSPGKRLRPLMVIAASLASRGHIPAWRALRHARTSACAVEYVHTYSLIHDDLPCMDDDDYRRGRPSTHRRFDEGLAVLAGDALLADAFFMASKASVNAHAIVQELAITAGSSGLVAGQAEDLSTAEDTTRERWLLINNAKTARLFEACAVIGGLCVNASKNDVAALRGFGQHFGVAFQIKDDLDDHAGIARDGASQNVQSMLRCHIDAAMHHIEGLAHPQALREILHLTFATAV